MNRIDDIERELGALVDQHLRDEPLSEEELDRLTHIMQRTLDSAAQDHNEEHLSPGGSRQVEHGEHAQVRRA